MERWQHVFCSIDPHLQGWDVLQTLLVIFGYYRGFRMLSHILNVFDNNASDLIAFDRNVIFATVGFVALFPTERGDKRNFWYGLFQSCFGYTYNGMYIRQQILRSLDGAACQLWPQRIFPYLWQNSLVSKCSSPCGDLCVFPPCAKRFSFDYVHFACVFRRPGINCCCTLREMSQWPRQLSTLDLRHWLMRRSPWKILFVETSMVTPRTFIFLLLVLFTPLRTVISNLNLFNFMGIEPECSLQGL